MMVKQEKEPILVRIDEAARELLADRPDGIIPVSGNFTIVCRTNLIGEYEYEVYSYRTVVAFVSFDAATSLPGHPVRPIVRVCNDAFDHTRTTSRHLHRFITALMEHRRVDWDKLGQLCDESKAGGTSTVIVPVI
jgi:hypothetical protein